MTGTPVVVVGDLGVDVLVTPSTPPVPGADVPARIRTTAGGAGANTAAWLAHRGAAVTLVARVGDDGPGRAAVAELAASGVHVAAAVDPQAPTCTVVVLLDGDRTMLSDRGAAARLSPADLPALTGRGHLHLSGYVLLDPPSRPAGLAALAAARAAGWTTSVDPQAAPALTPEFRGWVRGVDLLLPNADELAALGGSAEALLDVVGAVAVTDGEHGARWVDRTGSWSVVAEAVTPVDPTGAGDAFDAGLLAARLAGAGPEEALAAGCAAGAEAVRHPGARPVTP
ncbi:ribokinase [Pseudonocardia sp. KRD-184]|uniref:Ribokinase n=2 Tax=Pseudonocardia oceani TaxID=2792013 RepID=A0ABS6UGM2_9PSEU|nr:PfkB family carbohydrate kinase [Pseudonocardia oceani]MBW0092961.1 ribokinase [Pseudonocardia oceani]MBW0099722.1 ribokinase [Pseudonocardia oceani]MBW0120351.1 ribokinase [Pseudonocardia oceani]MBW0131395.1 ribokinase [Pseudonocardia oceani]